MSHGRFDNPVQAALAGVLDLFRAQPLEGAITPALRLDGRTVLVTGASSGLGLALSVQLAERGAHVLMACRSRIPEAGDEVKQRSGSSRVEMIPVDLADSASIDEFTATLISRGQRIDVFIANAGVTLPRARQTKQGQDEMFMVNYLANVIVLDRLLQAGIIPNETFAKNGTAPRPRILFVSSDSHQGSSAIDWQELGIYSDYGVRKAINNYSYFKLILNTYAVELSRRLRRADGSPDVGVHVFCPGPVNTNIIREAPWLLRVTLRAIFAVFFRAPDVAAAPGLYLAAAGDLETETGRYLHMLIPKSMDPKCYDPEAGAELWRRSELLVRELAS